MKSSRRYAVWLLLSVLAVGAEGFGAMRPTAPPAALRLMPPALGLGAPTVDPRRLQAEFLGDMTPSLDAAETISVSIVEKPDSPGAVLSDLERGTGRVNFDASPEELLADLAANPPAAVFTDYDGTLTDRGPNGRSLPAPAELVAEIERSLALGLPVVPASARNFDYQPPEAVEPGSKGVIPYELYQTLISRFDPSLRERLFFAGGLGGEIVLFSPATGDPIRYLQSSWDAGEKELIVSVVDRALAEAGVSGGELAKITSNPNQIALVFDPAQADRAKAFGEILKRRFKENDLLLQVIRSRNWVYFSKFDKSDAARIAYAVLKAKGYPVTPGNLLLLGDEFHRPKGSPMGGDVPMALAFPESRAVSVGGSPEDPMPPNVRRLGILGAGGSLKIFKAINQGLADRLASSRTGG